MSHTLRSNTSSPAVAFFNKFPFEGIVWTKTREADGKVSVQLSRKRHGRPVHSKWHCTREEAVECLREKCISMGREVPVISHKRHVQVGVGDIHQLFGLYRDGKDMSNLFQLSSSAWQAYATRDQCEYRLWTADDVDQFIQLEAPGWV